MISQFGISRLGAYVPVMDSRAGGGELEVLLRLLKEVRLEAGLKQEDLARRLNRPQSFVSKYESGERRLGLLELRTICLALGLSLEEFVNRFEQVVG